MQGRHRRHSAGNEAGACTEHRQNAEHESQKLDDARSPLTRRIPHRNTRGIARGVDDSVTAVDGEHPLEQPPLADLASARLGKQPQMERIGRERAHERQGQPGEIGRIRKLEPGQFAAAHGGDGLAAAPRKW